MKTQFLRTTVAVGALLAAPMGAQALTVTVSDDAQALAEALFLAVPGLTVTSSTLSGSFDDQGGQAGLFTNDSGTYGLPGSGIVVSSGNVLDYADGENTSSSFSTNYGVLAEGSTEGFEGGPEFVDGGVEIDGEFFPIIDGGIDTGDGFVPIEDLFPQANAQNNEVAIPAAFAVDVNGNTVTQQDLLGPITGREDHYDAVQLDIEFLADDNIESVTFFAAFGSEEYPEFVGSEFNDGFGLFVNGQNIAGVQPTSGGENQPVNISHPDMTDAFGGTELDGVLAPNGNPVLQFDVGGLVAGQANTFTIILADAGDSGYDTTTYLSSFIPTVIVNPDTGTPTDANDGGTEFTPLLPNNPPDEVTGAFVIELPVTESGFFDPDVILWVDPPYAIGYTYSVSNGAMIEAVKAPSGATVPDLDGYTITANGMTKALGVGQTKTIFELFGVQSVSFIEIGGIDDGLADTAFTDAFPFGLALTGPSGSASVTITPVLDVQVAPVPLPAGAALYLGGLAFAGFAGRRLKKARKS